MKKAIFSIIVFGLMCSRVAAQGAVSPKESDMSAYLLVYFTDPTHGLYFALSPDGYEFTDVNGGNPDRKSVV
jgi:hypothetical protein